MFTLSCAGYHCLYFSLNVQYNSGSVPAFSPLLYFPKGSWGGCIASPRTPKKVCQIPTLLPSPRLAPSPRILSVYDPWPSLSSTSEFPLSLVLTFPPSLLPSFPPSRLFLFGEINVLLEILGTKKFQIRYDIKASKNVTQIPS